jgi:hypothetical protein
MKGNMLLGFVALSLALLAYSERQTVPPTPAVAPEEVSQPLFSLQPAEIDAIRVRDLHGCVIVRREGTALQDIERLVESLVQARVVRRFSPVSADLSAYGLTRPVRQIEIQWANGARRRNVEMGELNPVGNAVYAHADNESEVLLVGSYFLTSLDMALQGLRAEGRKFVELNCSEGS